MKRGRVDSPRPCPSPLLVSYFLFKLFRRLVGLYFALELLLGLEGLFVLRRALPGRLKFLGTLWSLVLETLSDESFLGVGDAG
jgi:hypothetical protein